MKNLETIFTNLKHENDEEIFNNVIANYQDNLN